MVQVSPPLLSPVDIECDIAAQRPALVAFDLPDKLAPLHSGTEASIVDGRTNHAGPGHRFCSKPLEPIFYIA